MKRNTRQNPLSLSQDDLELVHPQLSLLSLGSSRGVFTDTQKNPLSTSANLSQSKKQHQICHQMSIPELNTSALLLHQSRSLGDSMMPQLCNSLMLPNAYDRRLVDLNSCQFPSQSSSLLLTSKKMTSSGAPVASVLAPPVGSTEWFRAQQEKNHILMAPLSNSLQVGASSNFMNTNNLMASKSSSNKYIGKGALGLAVGCIDSNDRMGSKSNMLLVPQPPLASSSHNSQEPSNSSKLKKQMQFDVNGLNSQSLQTIQRLTAPSSSTHQLSKLLAAKQADSLERDRIVHNVKNQLRYEIQQFSKVKSERESKAKENAERLLKIEHQQDNVEHVAVSCKQLEKMLIQLNDETTVDDVSVVPGQTTSDASPGGAGTDNVGKNKNPYPAGGEVSDEVLALRAFASDDTTLETTSVGDYASDPPRPPVFSDTCISDCIELMQTSHNKLYDSVNTLQHLVKDNPQWWNSAIIVRRLKTHAIRANYHARKVEMTGNQCRSHLFVNNSVINKLAMDATKEFRDLKEHHVTIQQRKDNIGEREKILVEETKKIQEEFDEVNAEKMKIDLQLQTKAKEWCGITEEAHLEELDRCECALLLTKLVHYPQFVKAVKRTMDLLSHAPPLSSQQQNDQQPEENKQPSKEVREEVKGRADKKKLGRKNE